MLTTHCCRWLGWSMSIEASSNFFWIEFLALDFYVFWTKPFTSCRVEPYYLRAIESLEQSLCIRTFDLVFSISSRISHLKPNPQLLCFGSWIFWFEYLRSSLQVFKFRTAWGFESLCYDDDNKNIVELSYVIVKPSHKMSPTFVHIRLCHSN